MTRFFFIGLLAITQTACATVVRGVNEPFKVISEPSGASAITTLETQASKEARAKNPSLAPQYHGCSPTPCEFTVPRRSKFIARLDKEGYTPVQFAVKSKASLGGQASGVVPTGSVAVGGAIAAANAAPGFLGLNAYFAGANAASATLLTVPAIAVDSATGGMLSLYPNPVIVQLTPLSDSNTVNYDLDSLSDGDDTIDYGYTAQQKKARQNAEPQSE